VVRGKALRVVHKKLTIIFPFIFTGEVPEAI